ncbi:MAG: NAD(P)-dependent alcohol dehydrogenase [Chloroflexi bacterium]|nr:NAD(P)-dependent alcohol dehydrogenase [Chloroflexota bacterium]
MKAAVRYRYGSPDVVELRDIEKPTPADDQVLVRVMAASVNRGDLDGIVGRPRFVRLFTGLRTPRDPRLGIDVAGVVESVGQAVTRFRPGDEVFGDGFRFGTTSFAEYIVAREKVLDTIPAGLSMDEASTLPHSAVLALQAMRDRNGRTFEPGAKVLVDGASGSVGPFAVQIAKAMGAEVTGTCRTEKMDFVRSLGADHVIDYTKTDYTRAGERYDWIVDTDSHHSLFRARRALARGGTYVTLGGWDSAILAGLLLGPLISRFSDRWSGLMLWWKPFHAPDVDAIKALIAAGKLKPAIDRRYRLSEIVDALRWVEEGRAKGKVIVTP